MWNIGTSIPTPGDTVIQLLTMSTGVGRKHNLNGKNLAIGTTQSGNGKHTTDQNGDDWVMLYYCLTHKKKMILHDFTAFPHI